MYASQRLQAGNVTMDESEGLGILRHLNVEELQKLLDDDDRLNALINDVPQVKNLVSEKQMLMASNKSLAEFNLSREPRLIQGKERLASAHEQAKQLQEEVLENKGKLLSNEDDLTLDTALAMLQTKASKTEDDSEDLAEKLLDKSVDIEIFLDLFIPRKTLAHVRKVKAEKMGELVRSQGTQHPGGNMHQWNHPGGQGMPDPSQFMRR
ncbi:vacuolar protein sorting-associated protein 37B-like [Lineus longissimus]|uniref:vacuolar protein sorting-associated protein 37B-like n=1 Tax=Lineus longissimus TaxID=88925 RepID=UPI002B4E02A8